LPGGAVTGSFNAAYGNAAGTAATGVANAAFGAVAGIAVTGDANIATGALAGAFVNGNNNVAIGSVADIFAPNPIGTGTNVTGSNNVALGTAAGHDITASNTISMGTNALASGSSSIAMGTNAFAAGPGDTAIGEGATVTADHGTAIGAGATATLPNQVVLGTKSDTYTAPGITSSLSRSRQSGPLEVVTSDANGNLATDGGAFFNQLNNDLKRIDENTSGVALAMSMENPDLTGNERFGMAANWGNFEGANALGLSLMGVLGNNFVTKGDRVALSGGFGVGFEEGDGDSVYGGRVGLQWTR